MALREGLYVIESKLTGGTIGRNVHEDRSLLPKAIVLHPTGGDLLPQASVSFCLNDVLYDQRSRLVCPGLISG
jgi:hypothetical protein